MYLRVNWIRYLGSKRRHLVTALGGKPQAAVTKDTTILVVGKANTNLFQEDPRSLKMQKVEALQQEGHSVCVLSEQAFSGESSVTPKSSSGDHERESWIGIPLFNFRMFNYLTEMKKKE